MGEHFLVRHTPSASSVDFLAATHLFKSRISLILTAYISCRWLIAIIDQNTVGMIRQLQVVRLVDGLTFSERRQGSSNVTFAPGSLCE